MGKAGAVFALNSSELHDGRPAAASGFTYRAVHIAPEAIRRVLENICDRPMRLPFFAEAMLRDPVLPPLMRDLHAAFAPGSRAFQRVYGLPPHAYLRQRRLHEARRLLAAGEAPAAVAAAAGFADQSHLTKRFKGAFGLTPACYRAAIIGPR